MNEDGEGLHRSAVCPLAPVRAWTDHELNGEIGVAAYGPLSPDPSYRHSTLSFADRAPVIGVPKAHYTVPSLALAIGQWRRASRDRGCIPHSKCSK